MPVQLGRRRSEQRVASVEDRGGIDPRRMGVSECFIVGSANDEGTTKLSDVMADSGLRTTLIPSLAALRTDRRFVDALRPLVLVADGPANPLDVASVLSFVQDGNTHGFTVCVADVIEPAAYKQLLRTGSADWMTARDCREELHDLFERTAVASASKHAAVVVSCLPSKGGVGNTSMAVEIATHLATRRKRDRPRLAVVDLNFQGGTLADALDLDARFDVAEIIDRPERLDEHLVDIFASRHTKGFDVFACPPSRLDPEAIKPEIVFAVIDAIASRYGVLLFDLPPSWASWTDDLLRGSDAILACGGESVPALRKLGLLLKYLDELPVAAAKVTAVVNAVETGFVGRVSRRPVIEKALSGRHVVCVRRDSDKARDALDMGRALIDVAPHSGIVRDIRLLAKWVEAIVDGQAKASGRAPAAKKAVG